MRCVLVMEDCSDQGPWFQSLLEKAGYKVTWAADPVEAMEFLQGEMKYDFVWSDGTNWEDCYKFAINLYGKEKVLVFTGSRDIASEVGSLGVKVFEKPEHPDVLVRYIVKCCPPD